jgi:hypothetical protein
MQDYFYMTSPSDLGFDKESTILFLTQQYKATYIAALESINASREFHKHDLHGAKEARYSSRSSNKFSLATANLEQVYQNKKARFEEIKALLQRDQLNLEIKHRLYLENWDLPSILTVSSERNGEETTTYLSVPLFTEIKHSKNCRSVLCTYRDVDFRPKAISIEEAKDLNNQHFHFECEPEMTAITFRMYTPTFNPPTY